MKLPGFDASTTLSMTQPDGRYNLKMEGNKTKIADSFPSAIFKFSNYLIFKSSLKLFLAILLFRFGCFLE